MFPVDQRSNGLNTHAEGIVRLRCKVDQRPSLFDSTQAKISVDDPPQQRFILASPLQQCSQLRHRRIKRNVVDSSCSFGDNRVVGVMEKSGDAGISKASPGQQNGQPHTTIGVRVDQQPICIVDHGKRHHPRMPQESVSIIVLAQHFNEGQYRRLVLTLTQSVSRKETYARTHIPQSFQKQLGGLRVASFSQHFGHLSPYFVIVIVQQRNQSLRSSTIAVTEHTQPPNRMQPRQPVIFMQCDLSQVVQGNTSTVRQRKLGPLAYAQILVLQ